MRILYQLSLFIRSGDCDVGKIFICLFIYLFILLYEQCDPSYIVSNIIGGQDSYTGRLEAGTSCVLYLCDQGNLTLIRKKSVATMADTC